LSPPSRIAEHRPHDEAEALLPRERAIHGAAAQALRERWNIVVE